MFSGFLNFFNKTVQYDIYGSDYRTFVIAFGRMQFGKGLFTVFDRGDVRYWEQNVARAFPEYKGKFELFGYDWMGRCFGVSTTNENSESVLIFDPSTLEAHEIPLGLAEFVNRAIPMSTDSCLASDAFIRWYNATGAGLEEFQCVGHKVPLFMGGVDAGDNIEISNMDAYWHMVGKIVMQNRGGEERPIAKDIDDDEVDIFEDDFVDEWESEDVDIQDADEAEEFFVLQQKRAPYIKKNVDKYLEKFKKMHINDSKISWNWCAFLFAGVWHLYRKLYKCFILMLLISTVVSYAIGYGLGFGLAMAGFSMQDVIVAASIVGVVVMLVIMVILGMFSNYWYRKKIDKLVLAGENAQTREEADKALKRGGVNIPLLVVYIVIGAVATIPLLFI